MAQVFYPHHMTLDTTQTPFSKYPRLLPQGYEGEGESLDLQRKQQATGLEKKIMLSRVIVEVIDVVRIGYRIYSLHL
jgi:hypothetical protein